MVKNHYEIFGLENPEKSPLILMIHGAAGDLHHYKTVTPALVEKGYRVLLMDVRYHGLSQLEEDENVDPETTTWTFAEVLQDIDSMLDKIKECHYQETKEITLFVAGLSMGGLTTLLYAERRAKEEKEGIKLAGIIPIASAIPHLEITRPGWDLYAERKATPEILEWSKTSIIASSITPEGQEETRRAMQLISNHSLYECLVAIGSMLPNPSDPPVPYTAVNVPTLLIFPDQDPLTKPEMDLFYNLCKEQKVDVEKIEIKDAGHMVILDQGPQVGNHITKFVERVFAKN
ncbi:Alpha/Beta hydrolase protein [Parasitella parasitica]|nr:Alpha/Beta hydrolase protein [Parasitella parasitica]